MLLNFVQYHLYYCIKTYSLDFCYMIKTLANIYQVASACRITSEAKYKEPEIVLSLAIDNNKFSFGGRGDISVFTGKPKVRKTFLLGIIAESVINNKSSVVDSNTINQKVLYFDTGQSNYHA